MNVEKIMSKTVVTVEMDDSLRVVKDIFDHTRFHHLLVVGSEKLVGVISDRDLLKALSPDIGTLRETTRDLACLNKRAHQIMTRNPVTLSSGAKVVDAVDLFNNRNFSCVPIVDENFRPVGIISWRDILKLLGPK